MTILEVWIPGEFTTLNDYIDAERTNRFAGASIKKAETQRVTSQVRDCPPVARYPVRVRFHWVRANAKSDPDNVAFAQKFLLDGLVQAGILENDGPKQIAEIVHTFEVSKTETGVSVTLESIA